MSEELAGMPQSMLREVVLRLICPETPPGIKASSEIGLRERQATDFLRPPGSKGLVRSQEALDFLNRFNAHESLLDEIAGLFLDVAESSIPHHKLLNPYVTGMFVFKEVLYAHRVVMMGASRETMERLMRQLVHGGWQIQAEELAAKLGRQLTRDEVIGLVQRYTKGVVYSEKYDRYWPEFAGKYLGEEGRRLVQGWIRARNEEAAHDLW